MKIHQCEQGSEEWYKLRLGIPTASEFHRIVSPTGKLSTQAEEYMYHLLAEWVLAAPIESTETRYMQRGHELEAQAVASYEFERDVEVEPVGFITTDDGMIGASPDRLVGTNGLLEIKCPAPHTHIQYMTAKGVDKRYYPQCQGQLLVSEREWMDIQSYYPGLPTVIVRVERDEKYLKILAEALWTFVQTMLDARADLEKRFGPFKRPEPKKGNPVWEPDWERLFPWMKENPKPAGEQPDGTLVVPR